MFRLKFLPLFVVPFCFAAGAHAQSHARSLVTVSCSCDDATGKAYAKALNDALAASPLYKVVDSEEGMEKDAIRINIVSLPLEAQDPERPQSALSIVCLHQGALMHQFIETCNRIPIEDCAKSMVADLADWDSSAT